MDKESFISEAIILDSNTNEAVEIDLFCMGMPSHKTFYIRFIEQNIAEGKSVIFVSN